VSIGFATAALLKTTSMGQSTTEEYEMDETVTDGTWTLNGNTLTVTSDFGPQTATILEQTSTALKLKAEDSENQSDQGSLYRLKSRPFTLSQNDNLAIM